MAEAWEALGPVPGCAGSRWRVEGFFVLFVVGRVRCWLSRFCFEIDRVGCLMCSESLYDVGSDLQLLEPSIRVSSIKIL